MVRVLAAGLGAGAAPAALEVPGTPTVWEVKERLQVRAPAALGGALGGSSHAWRQIRDTVATGGEGGAATGVRRRFPPTPFPPSPHSPSPSRPKPPPPPAFGTRREATAAMTALGRGEGTSVGALPPSAFRLRLRPPGRREGPGAAAAGGPG